jgi:hypothetical protein
MNCRSQSRFTPWLMRRRNGDERSGARRIAWIGLIWSAIHQLEHMSDKHKWNPWIVTVAIWVAIPFQFAALAIAFQGK